MKKYIAAMFGVFVMAVLAGAPVAFADDISVTTTVSTYLTATFNYNTVPFSSLSADTHDNAAPDQLDGAYNVTIDTNKNFKVSALGTSVFSDGAGHSFVIGNLKMDENTAAGSIVNTSATVITTGSQVIGNDIAYTNTIDFHGFWLSIPAAQYAATYNATLTATYANM